MTPLKQLYGQMLLGAKSRDEIISFAATFPMHLPAPSFSSATRCVLNELPMSPPLHSNGFRFSGIWAPGCRADATASIYVVDDEEGVTELYAAVLKTVGHSVRTFNDRSAALTALTVENERPNLLITDYRGHAMPVDRFLRLCRTVHPTLRILMASAFHPTDVRFARPRPDRFLQKPFTPDELRQEVTATLAAR